MKTARLAKDNSTTSSSERGTHTGRDNKTNSYEKHVPTSYEFLRANSTSTMWLSNSLHAEIGPLVEAITRHARLPSFHNLSLDPKVSEQAIALLGRLIYNYPIKTPTFFPQEGETVVFKWDGDRIGRYLSISSDGISLMDVEPISQKYCEYDLSEGQELDFELLVSELANTSLSSTTI